MKLTNFPKCGGRVRTESIGWKCEKCKGFIYMSGSFHEHIEKPFLPPMTNADRIRAMSDEELAVFLGDDDRCCPPKHPNCKNYINDCSGCFLEWLKQPVEVE